MSLRIKNVELIDEAVSAWAYCSAAEQQQTIGNRRTAQCTPGPHCTACHLENIHVHARSHLPHGTALPAVTYTCSVHSVAPLN